MTNMTIQTEAAFHNNSTKHIYHFQSYVIHSWSPLQIEESEAQILLRASQVKDYFLHQNQSIFTHRVLAPHPEHAYKLGYYWSIYALACNTLINQKNDPDQNLSTFYTLLGVIRQYSKSHVFMTEPDQFLLGLCYYYMAFCKMYGLGIQKNKIKAMKYLTFAATRGLTPASEFLKLTDQLGLIPLIPKKKLFSIKNHKQKTIHFSHRF